MKLTEIRPRIDGGKLFCKRRGNINKSHGRMLFNFSMLFIKIRKESQFVPGEDRHTGY